MGSSIKRLEGRVAIITGGASGIGKSAVHLFWEKGTKIVIADIQDTLANFIHCNITNEDEIIYLIDSSVEKYGRLDIMYNNAGVYDRIGSILDAKKEDVGVNLVGSLLGAKHAAKAMIPQRKDCILLTSSAATAISGISTHQYAMSKCGILGLMRNLAAELGQYGIRVNCVSPSGLATKILSSDYTEEQKAASEMKLMTLGNLRGKILRSEDVAKFALFLASDDSGYVSGLNLVVDGGISIINPTMWKAVGLIK